MQEWHNAAVTGTLASKVVGSTPTQGLSVWSSYRGLEVQNTSAKKKLNAKEKTKNAKEKMQKRKHEQKRKCNTLTKTEVTHKK